MSDDEFCGGRDGGDTRVLGGSFYDTSRPPAMSDVAELPDLAELCLRLQRDAQAHAVLVVGSEGDLMEHSGGTGSLSDLVLDAVGDLTADLLTRSPSPATAATHTEDGREGDDLVVEVESMHICAAPIADKATLVVVFDSTTKLSVVRLRMKRARELIAKSLDAR